MTPTTDLGLSIRLSMFELRETGDWEIFLGPPERARAETGGADQWVLKRRELPGFARVNQVTSASLRYPLSVFNKNSSLKSRNVLQINVFACVSCSISLWVVYMYVRMPSSPRSIVGVSSPWSLPGFPISGHHLWQFLLYWEGHLCGWITTKRTLAKKPFLT